MLGLFCRILQSLCWDCFVVFFSPYVGIVLSYSPVLMLGLFCRILQSLCWDCFVVFFSPYVGFVLSYSSVIMFELFCRILQSLCWDCFVVFFSPYVGIVLSYSSVLMLGLFLSECEQGQILLNIMFANLNFGCVAYFVLKCRKIIAGAIYILLFICLFSIAVTPATSI